MAPQVSTIGASLGAALSSAAGKLLALYKREPAATQTAIAVIYAGGIMCYHAFVTHTGVYSQQILWAGAIALLGLLVRAQVIPVVKIPAEVQAALTAGREINVAPIGAPPAKMSARWRGKPPAEPYHGEHEHEHEATEVIPVVPPKAP